MRKRSVASALYGGAWRDPMLGEVTVRHPSAADLARVDATWPALRPPGAEHADWRWQPVVS